MKAPRTGLELNSQIFWFDYFTQVQVKEKRMQSEFFQMEALPTLVFLLCFFVLFFNVMASGGLYSSIYITIHSPDLLSLCIGHNS